MYGEVFGYKAVQINMFQITLPAMFWVDCEKEKKKYKSLVNGKTGEIKKVLMAVFMSLVALRIMCNKKYMIPLFGMKKFT